MSVLVTFLAWELVYNITGSHAGVNEDSTTTLENRFPEDTERDLDNPIYGLEEDNTVDGAYETPHFDITYSSIDT